VNQTPATQVYAYRGIALYCAMPMISGAASGWKYNGGTDWVPATNGQADIYLSGPGCTNPSGEAHPTLHIPGGATTISTDFAFCNLSASQWANTASTVDLGVINQMNPDGSFNAEIIGKTADGAHTFKLFPNSFGGISPGNYAGAVEVSGASVDGF
jgi:hypothetical protein